MDLILNKKKGTCLPHASSIFKKISPKTFEPHCLYSRLLAERTVGGPVFLNMLYQF